LNRPATIDSFSDSAQRTHCLATDVGDRRIDRSQHERTDELHAPHYVAGNAPFERMEVDGDIGQLGHEATLQRLTAIIQCTRSE
jgi:hypothetical protein